MRLGFSFFQRTFWFLAPLLAAVFCVVGCGGHGEEGCGEFCTAVAACPNADFDEAACTKECEAESLRAEEGGCADQWTHLAECRSHAEDVCDATATSQECTIQAQAYLDCLPQK